MLKVLAQLLQNAVNTFAINADESEQNFATPRERSELAVV
jgi:hypothetical protein